MTNRRTHIRTDKPKAIGLSNFFKVSRISSDMISLKLFPYLNKSTLLRRPFEITTFAPLSRKKSRPGNIYITVGHTCSGKTLVEGLVELWSGYDVNLVRLHSIRSMFSRSMDSIVLRSKYLSNVLSFTAQFTAPVMSICLFELLFNVYNYGHDRTFPRY